MQFIVGEREYFQTLACPDNMLQFNYFTANDQFIPDVRNFADISILLRTQTLDKPLPHDRIIGTWAGAINERTEVNFSEVGVSIIAGNAFEDSAADVGKALINMQKFYLDLSGIQPAQSIAILT